MDYFGSFIFSTVKNAPEGHLSTRQLGKELEQLRGKEKRQGFSVAFSNHVDFAHWVSFVFEPQTQTLVIFNSGEEESWGDIVTKAVYGAMKRLFVDISILDYSFSDQNCVYGCIQSVGDEFCQSWSLLFLICYDHDPNLLFLNKWRRYDTLDKLKYLQSFIIQALDEFEDSLDAEANYQLQFVHQRPQQEVARVLKNHFGNLQAFLYHE
jgi:hypothetical protein